MVSWLRLRVAVPTASAESLADFLLAEGAPAVVRDIEGPTPGRVVVEAHVPATTHARVAAALAAYLAPIPDAAVESAPLGDVDWEAVYRRHHPPVFIGRRLAVAPPWDVPEAEGREVIVKGALRDGTFVDQRDSLYAAWQRAVERSRGWVTSGRAPGSPT